MIQLLTVKVLAPAPISMSVPALVLVVVRASIVDLPADPDIVDGQLGGPPADAKRGRAPRTGGSARRRSRRRRSGCGRHPSAEGSLASILEAPPEISQLLSSRSSRSATTWDMPKRARMDQGIRPASVMSPARRMQARTVPDGHRASLDPHVGDLPLEASPIEIRHRAVNVIARCAAPRAKTRWPVLHGAQRDGQFFCDVGSHHLVLTPSAPRESADRCPAHRTRDALPWCSRRRGAQQGRKALPMWDRGHVGEQGPRQARRAPTSTPSARPSVVDVRLRHSQAHVAPCPRTCDDPVVSSEAHA
jgi:hypothetical protein